MASSDVSHLPLGKSVPALICGSPKIVIGFVLLLFLLAIFQIYNPYTGELHVKVDPSEQSMLGSNHEGWEFYQYPGPGFKGLGPNSAESSYYSWVDQHNTFGLGKDVPMSTGNLNDGLIALKDDKMITLRVPYPMGFYAKGLDGRIDDPDSGWKGRGLWSTSGDRTPWLMEGGKGSKPLVVHFQLRPDPLAK